jgi:hypothetical protein
MKSFLKEIEDKFIELESEVDNTSESDEELDEMSATGAVAGFNTPAAFASPGKWKNKKAKYESKVDESINTPPNFQWDKEEYQTPESEEEEYMDKFPFAYSESDWQHANYEYPSKNLSNTPGTSTKKHASLKVGNDKKQKTSKIEEVLEQKYEQLIEGYQQYKSGDIQPSKKVKESIREIAKKLQEIETVLHHTSKLKNESGVAASQYGPGTTKALTKISERLIKISERVRSLGE